MEHGGFTFADQRVWATSRLNERFVHLQEHLSMPLSEERLHVIHIEMANIAFEGLQRMRETNQIAQFENEFNTEPMLPGMEAA